MSATAEIMMEIPEKDLSYIAGFFDGEGGITIVPFRDKRRGNIVKSFALHVFVANTVRLPIDFIVERFGGRVGAYQSSKHPDWREQFVVHYAGRNALSFLTALRPFVKLKIEQVNLGIEFLTRQQAYYRKDSSRRPNGQQLSLSEDEFRARALMCERMRRLNFRKNVHRTFPNDWESRA